MRDGHLDLVITQLNVEQVKLERGSVPAYEIEAEFRQNDLRSEAALSVFRLATQLMNDYQADMIRQRVDRKGPLAVGYDEIDGGATARCEPPYNYVQAFARAVMTDPDGLSAEGTGTFEVLSMGPNAKRGFTGFSDGAAA